MVGMRLCEEQVCIGRVGCGEELIVITKRLT
jgi:hypothetical protein